MFIYWKTSQQWEQVNLSNSTAWIGLINKVEERNKIRQEFTHLDCINIHFRNRPSKPLECCSPCVTFDMSNSYIGFYIMYCSNATYLYLSWCEFHIRRKKSVLLVSTSQIKSELLGRGPGSLYFKQYSQLNLRQH